MKFPDMNQYITLLFSLLAEFFLPHRTQPPARETGPRVRPRAPEMSRIYKIITISKIRGRRL